jgi:hypothetical protein
MHLVNQYSKRPPINRLAVTLVQKNFGCNVLGSAADSVGALLDYFSETIINQFQITVIRYHNVLRLQVTIHNVFTMQVFKH